jgi:hypothetical protein
MLKWWALMATLFRQDMIDSVQLKSISRLVELQCYNSIG